MSHAVPLVELFELSGDSFPGRDHLARGNLFIGKNNQDAYETRAWPDLVVAVAGDGCGSQAKSEFGAILGVRLLVKALRQQWNRLRAGFTAQSFDQAVAGLLEDARRDVVAHLRTMAKMLSFEDGAPDERWSAFVQGHMLFTLVGAILTPSGSAFFSLGDGMLVVNEEEFPIGPFPDDEPPYIAYDLLQTRWKEPELHFTIHKTLPTDAVNSFLVGSDGTRELSRLAMTTIPGTAEQIGPLSQFWTDDIYFTKTGIRRKLARINTRYVKVSAGELVIDDPRLPDDTTLVVGCRKKQSKGV
jgi:hypothetical protein